MSRLLARLGIANPIIQAPMAGGPTTPDLVVAVSEAGALGSIGAAYLSPRQIFETVGAVRARTAHAFNLNLFAPLPDPPPFDWAPTLAHLRRYHDELGIEPPATPQLHSQRGRFDAQLEAVLEARVPVFSFTFGLVPESALERLRATGTCIIGTATTVEEARGLERAGVDAIVAQGSEAGGHRGTFAAPFEEALIGTIALVPQIVDAVGVPVIASGGIMDGRGIAAALALGAEAVQLGTAFLTVAESGAPEAHKRAILHAPETATTITSAFSGRPARGLNNRIARDFAAETAAIGPYPLQNDVTRAMRRAAVAAQAPDYLSLWSGQAPRLARSVSARDLIESLVSETAAVIGALNS